MAGPTVDGTSSHGGQEVATAERPDQTPAGPSKSTSHQDLLRNLAISRGHDELLLEQEILGDHRSHAPGTTQLRDHDGEMEQGEQEVLHA